MTPHHQIIAVCSVAAIAGLPGYEALPGRTPITNTRQNKNENIMRKITKIIIHCSATPQGRHVTAKDIDSWHRARGFNSIGYHYVVLLDGTVETGRPLSTVGAHCLGQNSCSIGICYIGGLLKDCKTPADTRTPAQKQALRSLVAELKKRFPGVTLHGHCEFANKACPCFDIHDL